MMDTTPLRFKRFVTTHKRELLLTCSLLIIIAALIAFTGIVTSAVAFSPFAVEDVSTETTHTAGVSQAVSVNVTENTSAYTRGQTLTDKSLYPKTPTENPVITATADAQHATITGLEVAVTYTAAPRSDAADEFYTDTTTLETLTTDSAQAQTSASIPITSVFEEKQQLREEFGETVVVTAHVTTHATYEYHSATGETFTDTVSVTGNIRDESNMYSIGTGSEQTSQITGTPTTSQTGMTTFINLVSLLTIAVCIGMIGVTVYMGRVYNPRELMAELQRARFEDWVTEIESFTPQGQVNVVEVPTLGGLVNLAIDTQLRVLYHERVDEYIAINGSMIFKYKSDTSSTGKTTEFFGMDPDKIDLSNVSEKSLGSAEGGTGEDVFGFTAVDNSSNPDTGSNE